MASHSRNHPCRDVTRVLYWPLQLLWSHLTGLLVLELRIASYLNAIADIVRSPAHLWEVDWQVRKNVGGRHGEEFMLSKWTDSPKNTAKLIDANLLFGKETTCWF